MKGISSFLLMLTGLLVLVQNGNAQRRRGAELVITPYTTTIFTGNSDGAVIAVRVTDIAGKDMDTINKSLQIILQGDGRIVPDKGFPGRPEQVNDSIWEIPLLKGRTGFRLVAGEIPGRLIVDIRTEGAEPARTEIHSIAPFTQLKPDKSQLPPSDKVIEKMLGADISFLPQLEGRGIQFSDKGTEKDALAILRDHGFNYIRLRIFNDPGNEKGYSPKSAFCDLKHTLEMATRIKKAGLGFLLDFHYSDYWADPQQQNMPKAWKGLDGKVLQDSLYNYTRYVLSALKAQGTLPDMVQIGNEVNHGLLWPSGHIGNPGQLAGLLKAGSRAVKDVDPDIIVMMHIALGGQNRESVFWLDNMIARGVEFDIIGLSWYPRWHGTLDELNRNMRDLIVRYNKDINVVEYSAKKEEVADLVFNLPGNHGKGTFIWEPLNTWEQIFDKNGKSNDLMVTYDRISAKYLK